MFTLITALYRSRLLSISVIQELLKALTTTGLNLMVLLRIAIALHPQRIAITDDRQRLSYAQLWQHSQTLALALHQDYGIRSGQKVAIACRSHASAIRAIFAVSRLGAHIFLLNPEMSTDQFLALEQRLHVDFYIYDQQPGSPFEHAALKQKSLPAYASIDPSVASLCLAPRNGSLSRMNMGDFVVMTGGTTGAPKSIHRRPALLSYLPPFFALLTQMEMDRFHRLYIPAPIYHGYGLSLLFMGIALGQEMYFTERFNAAHSCELIVRHGIQALIVVPLMLQRMLKHDPSALASLRCILSGSAVLSPELLKQSQAQLGPILFNLYGSSEAGFSLMADPQLLHSKPASIGRALPGVQARIIDEQGQHLPTGAIGQLCIRSSWTAKGNTWVETGDLAYYDADDDFFLIGRSDDMIISGGEKVYPIELETILAQHPEVEAVAVVGIPDQESGQRLKALLVTKSGARLEQEAVLEWLKPRVARYQMPALIECCAELPYTAIGKMNKKALREAQEKI